MLKANNRWKEFYKFERKFKQQFLKKLTFKQSLAISNNLYQFAYLFIDRHKFNSAKLELLSERHTIFNKIKA